MHASDRTGHPEQSRRPARRTSAVSPLRHQCTTFPRSIEPTGLCASTAGPSGGRTLQRDAPGKRPAGRPPRRLRGPLSDGRSPMTPRTNNEFPPRSLAHRSRGPSLDRQCRSVASGDDAPQRWDALTRRRFSPSRRPDRPGAAAPRFRVPDATIAPSGKPPALIGSFFPGTG